MAFEDLVALSRRDRMRLAGFVIILLAMAIGVSVKFMQSGLPRHLVLASGAEGGIYHRYALRYKEILGREGVKVDVRMTRGANDNLGLLLDPKSGVDVAFMQGGIAAFPEDRGLEMLASLYYEPLWIFYRNAEPLTRMNELHGKRIAIGTAGSGTRSLVAQLFAANGLTNAAGVGRDNTDIVALGGDDALRALRAGEIDAALFVGGADTPTIQEALRDPVIKLMSLRRADAYMRRFLF
jgi:TRAP-type uncharacterized transport system substrate-binding protein